MSAGVTLPTRFRSLPYHQIHPQGWLARQLRIQADGLGGHLDEFWPDIQNSRWFGGDSEAWERAPYWLDGMLPLAYLLDDDQLKTKVNQYLDYILTHQGEDGWLGPRTMVVAAGAQEIPNYDLWAQFLALKVLVQYAQVTDPDREMLVTQAVEKNLRCIDQYIDRAPLFNWGQFRWFEGLIAIYWLYEKKPDPWLLHLAVKLHAQGFDWTAFFNRWPYTEPIQNGRWSFMSHVVNNAMAPKAPGLWWQLSQNEQDRQSAYTILEQLDKYHGMATGVFTGDECLAGKNPAQGTELCAVVELAYSLEILQRIYGDPILGDQLERIIFNALPATFSSDMWSHQYDQQANQVECSILANRLWKTNGPDSNIFGLEPNFGCCTANFSQGWPKFAAHIWFLSDDEGLGVGVYAPSSADITLHGAKVQASIETDYPFREDIHITINTASEVEFPLYLRIPTWANESTIGLKDETYHPQAGIYFKLHRKWSGETKIQLRFSMQPTLWHGENGAVAILRGPLTFALPIGEDWRRVNQDHPDRQLPHADWEVFPTSPWNYALLLKADQLAESLQISHHPMNDTPFSPHGAPISIHVTGQRLPEWGMLNGSAEKVPPGPIHSTGHLEQLRLIPYGCTHLRITEFPVVAV